MYNRYLHPEEPVYRATAFEERESEPTGGENTEYRDSPFSRLHDMLHGSGSGHPLRDLLSHFHLDELDTGDLMLLLLLFFLMEEKADDELLLALGLLLIL